MGVRQDYLTKKILIEEMLDCPKRIFALKSKVNDLITAIAKLEDFDQQIFSRTDDAGIDAKMQSACDVNEGHRDTLYSPLHKLMQWEAVEAIQAEA